MSLIPISEFVQKGKTYPDYARLAEICNKYKGLWSTEAEAYLLANSDKL